MDGLFPDDSPGYSPLSPSDSTSFPLFGGPPFLDSQRIEPEPSRISFQDFLSAINGPPGPLSFFHDDDDDNEKERTKKKEKEAPTAPPPAPELKNDKLVILGPSKVWINPAVPASVVHSVLYQ